MMKELEKVMIEDVENTNEEKSRQKDGGGRMGILDVLAIIFIVLKNNWFNTVVMVMGTQPNLDNRHFGYYKQHF